MKHPADGAVASIIIPCWDQLEFTRFCLAALVRHTRPPWELIVIDNGSTDGTGTYLASVQDVAPMPVIVVHNERNVGFPAAINQGLKAARGDYLVLMNNDAVVTNGWLDQLIALAEMPLKEDLTTEHTEITEMRTQQGEWTKGQHAKTIGLTGPMSNYASPPQLVENVPYANLEEMHAFAWRWREEHRGQWFTGGKLSGFCLLMKRAVYQAIGGLDEQFGLGFFDDDDLAERARRAGFELAVAHDLFVHHFGSRTFQGNGIDTERLLQENSEKFAHKWGLPVVGQRVSVRPCVEGGNGPQMTQMNADEETNQGNIFEKNGHRNEPTTRPGPSHLRSSASSADKKSGVSVSLTIIARDEQENLPKCLSSVVGLFDEIVVIDTGSNRPHAGDRPRVRGQGL
jgi:GT2 family glycosyltransferase